MTPLFKPYMPADLPELEGLLHSGQLAYGKWAREFEQKLREFIGVEYLMTTNSYSNAIQIALVALDLEPGDEVITSPMSCLNSNMPLRQFGLNVKWADIDPRTGTLAPESVEKAISKNTKLIFHNHFCGYIGYVDEVNEIAKRYGIPVIDDCVEAFGSKYKGKIAGNLGTDISVFSFQTVRLPNTIDGGAIVFKDKALYEKAIIIRDQGIRRSIFRDADGEISPDCDIYMRGFAGTMSDVNSYIGCEEMKVIDSLLAKQAANAKRWQDKLFDMPSLIDFIGREEISPNYWVCGILSSSKKGDMKMFKESGFACSTVHLPNTYYSVFGNQVQLSGVQDFYNRFIALPSGWWME